MDYNGILNEEGMADHRAVSHLYEKYRGEFIAYARKSFSLSTEQAVELYQDCFVALYENVKSGKLTELTCSLKTYLLGIARHKIFNRWRDDKPTTELQPEDMVSGNEEWDELQQSTYDMVQKMEEPCNTILTLYYWEECSMSEIARRMNYSGAQVAQNRKLRCMRKLKSLLYKQFVSEGLL